MNRSGPLLSDRLSHLQPMTAGIEPITVLEHEQRLEKARRLMVDNCLDAIYLEAGSSLYYYTGIRWERSERLMAAVIPARGDIAYVCPAFEEARLLELMRLGQDVRTWEDDENPYRLVAQLLRDRGLAKGTIGVEESVRFFVFDGIRAEMPRLGFASADPVTIPCRAIKSPAEITLMQRAMDITVEAYKATLSQLWEGMTPAEFGAASEAAHRALGAKGRIGCQFGERTAYPHGSDDETPLREGDVILMDGSCTVQGYYSDISRTIVFGRPTQRQRHVWELEKEAQASAFAAAQLGVPLEAVDAAARKVIVDAGFGPDYCVPGLPHRTGHGLGLDIHEWHHVVRGNKTPIVPGMVFSDEPMICIYGEFGVRLEDCIYVNAEGPRFFTQPSPSIEQPFA